MVEPGRGRRRDLLAAAESAAGERLLFPPTLLTDVHPASTVVQEEIFGPVLVAMTFRTPAEAAELANNTVYGLAASVWSENINVALDLASQVKAGVVWVNCTNQFDAACGFGGYRETGYGREGGREGMLEYLSRSGSSTLPSCPPPDPPAPPPTSEEERRSAATPAIDRTVKQYIGGKQARPDSGYSFPVFAPTGDCSAKRRSATAKTFATRSKPRATRSLGQEPPRTIARRCSITSPKI